MSPDERARPDVARIGRVGIVAKSHLTAASDLLSEIAQWLDDRGVTTVFEQETAALASVNPRYHSVDRDRLPHEVDLVLILGGDGTLIGMANRISAAEVDIPILGVNFGSLGFLTEITLPELYGSLESTLNGTADLDVRLMLRSTTTRAGAVISDRTVLNDVVINKGALARIVNLSVAVNGQFVTRFRADGVIVSSPTGSTAYNLAAAGPIVHPAVDAVILTPIAPHALADRPVVIPAASEIRLQPLVDSNDEIYVTFDGQSGFRLQGDDIVTIRRAARPLRLVRASARSYFEVLREKLKWGGR